MSDLGKAIRLMSEVFENVTDKGGEPYALHCLYVMECMREHGHAGMIVGVLHDVVEDTDERSKINVTFDMLRDEGFSEEIISGIDSVTRRDGETYSTFVERSSRDRLGKPCKKADLRHNSNITRLKGLERKDFDRLEKYARAYEYLSS